MDKIGLVHINKEEDIIAARKMGREFAAYLDFHQINQARILTVVSELARNIYRYAPEGNIQFEMLREPLKNGMKITAADNGPGIADIPKAMEQGFSSSGSLGAGIPGVKTMMDEFTLESFPGKGTKIEAVKWQLK